MHNMISAAATKSHVFFDRSIVDAVSGLEQMKVSVPPHLMKALQTFRYNKKVFITPPWPEIFRNDSERIHSYDHAVAEYTALLTSYQRIGHELFFVPKVSVPQRVDFILHELRL